MATVRPWQTNLARILTLLALVTPWLGGCPKEEPSRATPPPPVAVAPLPAPPPPKAVDPGAKHAAPSTQIATVDRILESLEWGNIAFNAPQSMNLKESAQIQLLLSLEESIEDLRKTLTQAGEKEGARIRVSDRMEARLTGPNFQIAAITPEEQAITSKGVTEWKWEVKPASGGRHHLHLTLTALFDVDGNSTRRAIRTFDKTIEVEVTWSDQTSQFVANNWQWLWAAILVPLIGWLWKGRKSHADR
jgi:hypothetical protein